MNFSGSLDRDAPPLPELFLFPATIIFALLAAYLALKTPGSAGRFVIFACWFRYTLSSLHAYTHQPAIAGITWAALGTVFIVVVGLLIIKWSRIAIASLIPVGAIACIMLMSSISNGNLVNLLEPLARLAVFVVICAAVLQDLQLRNAILLNRLLYLFIPLLLYQATSAILGIVKAAELDRSVSYIGGFNHEQQFSLILATCFLVAVIAHGTSRVFRAIMACLATIGILFANYRTVIVGLLPLIAVQFLLIGPRAVVRGQRNLVRIAVSLIAIGIFILAAGSFKDRFSDLRIAADQITLVFESPDSFQTDERRVLSGRLQIWSDYIHGYMAAPITNKVLGFGPESWAVMFQKNAHNTALSYLYEYGALGLIAILSLWLTMLWLAFRTTADIKSTLVASHVGFVVWNMATMVHWQVEGNILYGILCGITISKARVAGGKEDFVKVGENPQITQLVSSAKSGAHLR